MTIAINGNRHQEKHFHAIQRLVDTLVKAGVRVVMSDRFLDYLTRHLGPRFALGIDSCPLTRQPKADLAISIGGDGAFLKTAAWVGTSETPVAGINTGHLGYLSAFSFDREEEIYDFLIQGRCQVQPRSLLQIEIDAPQSATMRCGRPIPSVLTALNELAITRDQSSMLRIAAEINNRSSLNYMGDGLLISTPTGSTAYNLSVGGPILDPELRGWVISPIAAHSLSMRPLVVSDSGRIEIRVECRAESYRIATDGKSLTLPVESKLTISRAPYVVNLILQPNHSFADTLREKLGMGNTLA